MPTKKSVKKSARPSAKQLNDFQWDERRTKAAQMLAEGERSQEEIAKIIKVTRKTLWEWMQYPAFTARVDKIVEQTYEALKLSGIARKAHRITALDARWHAMRGLIEARGKEMADSGEIAGGETGLLVRDYKGKGNKPVYKADVGLLRELREHEKQAAIETGEWTEKRELSGPDGGAIPITIEDQITKVYGDSEKPTT